MTTTATTTATTMPTTSVAAGGWRGAKKEAESTAGHTSPLPHTFELNEIIVLGFYCMWMRDEYVRVERPSHGRVRRVHRGDTAAAAR